VRNLVILNSDSEISPEAFFILLPFSILRRVTTGYKGRPVKALLKMRMDKAEPAKYRV